MLALVVDTYIYGFHIVRSRSRYFFDSKRPEMEYSRIVKLLNISSDCLNSGDNFLYRFLYSWGYVYGSPPKRTPTRTTRFIVRSVLYCRFSNTKLNTSVTYKIDLFRLLSTAASRGNRLIVALCKLLRQFVIALCCARDGR